MIISRLKCFYSASGFAVHCYIIVRYVIVIVDVYCLLIDQEIASEEIMLPHDIDNR